MMNTKVAKRLALLVVLVMAALCLPVSGMAAVVEERVEKVDLLVGSNGYMNLFNPAQDYSKYCIDYDGDGKSTVEEWNENLTFEYKAGKGVSIVYEDLSFVQWEENGQTFWNYPSITYKVNSVEAHGQSITGTLKVNSTGETIEFEQVISVIGARKDPTVVASAGSALSKDEYGYYQMSVEEGSTVTITPNYETVDGKKMNLHYNWYIWNPETGYSDALSTASSHTFVVTAAHDGCDFEWQMYSPDYGFGDGCWITIHVVPKGTYSNVNLPTTGDSSTPMLWLLGMLIAGAGCAAMMLKRRQNG